MSAEILRDKASCPISPAAVAAVVQARREQQSAAEADAQAQRTEQEAAEANDRRRRVHAVSVAVSQLLFEHRSQNP
jgi:hypothetical protein